MAFPTVIDTTNVGGSSYQFHAAHARRDIQSGKAKVALLTYGSTAHSNARAIGVGGRGGASMHPAENMDAFAGMTLISNYAMVAHRHMHEYGAFTPRHNSSRSFSTDVGSVLQYVLPYLQPGHA